MRVYTIGRVIDRERENNVHNNIYTLLNSDTLQGLTLTENPGKGLERHS